MKNSGQWILLIVLFALTFIHAPSYYAQEGPKTKEDSLVITDGVVPGKFTQDYDSAMKYSKEKGLPVFLIFTGSDWCHWCKLMDKNVFKKTKWEEYAKDKLVQIWIDSPKNKDLVPEKYRQRNEDLKEEYGVRGFPTYFLLDSNGLKLGQLGAGQDKTPKSFIAEVNKSLLMTDSGMKKFCEGLKPEDAKKVMAHFTVYKQATLHKSELTKKLNAVKKEATETKKELDDSIEAGKVNAMSDEKKAEYETAKNALEKANTELEAWMKKNRRVRPTPELQKEFKGLNKAVSDAKAKVESF